MFSSYHTNSKVCYLVCFVRPCPLHPGKSSLTINLNKTISLNGNTITSPSFTFAGQAKWRILKAFNIMISIKECVLLVIKERETSHVELNFYFYNHFLSYQHRYNAFFVQTSVLFSYRFHSSTLRDLILLQRLTRPCLFCHSCFLFYMCSVITPTLSLYDIVC